MVRKVVLLGSGVLRGRSGAVSRGRIPSPAFQRFIDDLIDTMRDCDGVGIAAPQVGVRLRIFCVECVRNPRYPGAPQVPLYTVINPVVRVTDRSKILVTEGCLSVPGLRGEVPRAAEVELTGLDRRGKPIRVTARGFHARIIQHEFDHLNGRVYLDRMNNLKSLTVSAAPVFRCSRRFDR